MRAIALAILLLLQPLAGCAERETAGSSAGTAPDWSFVDTQGVAHSRDEPAGNATVIFFMASWCGTCRSKAPMLARVHADAAEQGVRFYSVSFDRSDDDATLESWKAKVQNDWPHGVDPSFRIQRAFGITAQSSVVVLDSEGGLVEKWGYGGVQEDALREAIDRALAA